MKGFYILDTNTYSDDLKKYVNLSTFCWETINSDMRFFSLYGNEITLSGFLNTILKNFYLSSKASITNLIYKKREEYNSLFNKSQYKNSDKELIEKIKDDLIDKYHQELITENLSYPKGSGHYFRINNDVAELLNDTVENSDIDDAGESLGCYLKVIFEEYSRLPQCERIRVYFKDVVDTIQEAIANKKGIKVIQRPFERFDKNSEPGTARIVKTNKYYVKPYKIVSDDSFQYLYLIGLSELADDSNQLQRKDMEPHSLRISLIQRVTILQSMNGFISKEDKERMDERLIANGPQSFIDPNDPAKMLEIKVRFDNHGLETLKRVSYGRPKSFKKLDSNTYVFYSDFFQARNYFWRFANNVEILEPLSLRESVKKMLALTTAVYKEEKE